MARKVEKPHNCGTWSEARKRAFIVSALRYASRKWGPMHACKRAGKLGRNQYLCASCGSVVGNKDIAVDHIHPVIDPEVGFVSWDVYIERMFPEQDGYQLLCSKCHEQKTAKERALAQRRKSQENHGGPED